MNRPEVSALPSCQLPPRMKRIAVSEPGGPEKLILEDIARPEPAHDEVLIKVAGAGLNRGDIAQRQGFYPPPPGASDTPGLEVSGTIVATGARVTDWTIGDLVCALIPGGGYAQYCTVNAAHVLPVPGDFSLTQAAGIPETVMTVWTNIFEQGALKPGETLLVHGGTSGIGTTAIQMAKLHGAQILATAGSAEKVRMCEELGAKRGINYREEDFADVVKDMTQGRGADVILDIIGGTYIQQNINCAAENGRIVNIAYQDGFQAKVNFLRVMLKRLTLTGSTLRARSVAEKAALTRAVREHVWPWLESRQMEPVIHATFPLAEAAQAHQMMEEGRHSGKIILIP